MDSSHQQQVLEYEDFLENVLKRRLREQLEECRSISQKLDEIAALRENIKDLIKQHSTDWDAPKVLDSLVNLWICSVVLH